jgi:hypothetical protein
MRGELNASWRLGKFGPKLWLISHLKSQPADSDDTGYQEDETESKLCVGDEISEADEVGVDEEDACGRDDPKQKLLISCLRLW